MIGLFLLACTKPSDEGTETAVWESGTTDPVASLCDAWTGMVVGRTQTLSLAGPGYSATSAYTVVSIDADGNVERTATAEGLSGDIPYTADVVETGHCDAHGYSLSRRALSYDDGWSVDNAYEPPLVWYWGDIAVGRQWTIDSEVTATYPSGPPDVYVTRATIDVAGQDTVATPSGTFLAFRLDYTDADGTLLSTDWMVKGLGRVLNITYSNYGTPESWIILQSIEDGG